MLWSICRAQGPGPVCKVDQPLLTAPHPTPVTILKATDSVSLNALSRKSTALKNR